MQYPVVDLWILMIKMNENTLLGGVYLPISYLRTFKLHILYILVI